MTFWFFAVVSMSGRGEMLFLLILLHIFRCHYFVEIHSIDKDKFIFIGNQIVGDMFIVKDIIPKRGQLKIRCSSECLRDVECGGFRIFLNATTCSLLGGKFQAVMESSSNARFYQVYFIDSLKLCYLKVKLNIIHIYHKERVLTQHLDIVYI